VLYGNPKRSWQPDAEGELLLQAALGGPSIAADAWRQWSRTGDVAAMNLGAARLLPLIDYNLQQHGLVHGVGPGASQALLAMWCETNMLLHESTPALARLNEIDVQTMILKGGALGMLDYPDPMLRPMTDVDVLVPAVQVSRAISSLHDAGWTTTAASAEPLLRFQHATSFTNGHGGSVDLHCRIFSQGRFSEREERDIWDSCVAVAVNGVTSRAPSVENRLLHVCVHGMGWNPMLPLRWVADAAMIIRRHDATIEWDTLVDIARRRDLVLPLTSALLLLRQRFDVAVPVETMRALTATPLSRAKRFAHRVRTGSEGSYLSLFQDWWIGWQTCGTAPPHRKASQFLEYYAASRGLRRGWQAPFHMLFTITRVLARIATSVPERFARRSA
jgi:hypothetical protein